MCTFGRVRNRDPPSIEYPHCRQCSEGVCQNQKQIDTFDSRSYLIRITNPKSKTNTLTIDQCKGCYQFRYIFLTRSTLIDIGHFRSILNQIRIHLNYFLRTSCQCCMSQIDSSRSAYTLGLPLSTHRIDSSHRIRYNSTSFLHNQAYFRTFSPIK